MMTALWAIAADLLAPLWPYIAAAGIAVAGWFAARRSGVRAQKAKTDAAQAKAREKTVKDVLNETTSSDTTDRLRERMHQRAKR